MQNILSEQTITEKLGYNYLDEKNKKDSEAEDNMMKNIERIQMLGDEVDVQKETKEENDEKEIKKELEEE